MSALGGGGEWNRQDVAEGGWQLVPLTVELLREVDTAFESLPADVFLRAGDALHLVSARAVGFSEIWSATCSERHGVSA